jgi:HK97 gp10 family phage protein
MPGRTVVELQGLDKVVRELQRRGLDVRQGLEQICHAGAAVVLADACARAPGHVAENLDKRTTARRVTRVEVSVGPVREKHLARWVEFGTKPHTIQPKGRKRGRKRALAIPGWGVYRRVRHPGSRKQPFLRPAYEAQKEHAQGAMGRATKQVLRA